MKKYFLLLLIPFLFACSKQTAKDGILIAVSIQPQSWFVSQIAGDKAKTVTLLPPGQNQHTFEPTPRQIESLALADAWVLSGAEFEIGLQPKVEKIFPNLRIVDGTQGVKFRLIDEDNHDSNYKTTLELDKHTWLGREPAKILAGHVKDVFCSLDDKNQEYYVKQYEALIKVIDDEFESLKISLAPLKGRNVFVYHPCFGYFFDEFGIRQEAVEVGGKEPSPRELNNLITKIKEGQAVAIIVQTQFPTSAAKTLAASAGLEVIALDPFSYNWLDNIRQIGQALNRCIR